MKSKSKFLFIAVLAIVMVVSWQVSAAVISMNFVENATNQIFTGGTPVGPVGTDGVYWNHNSTLGTGSSYASGTQGNLIDDTGANTGTSVTWLCSNTYYNADGTSNDQYKLSVGYLDDGQTSTGVGVDVTFSNIPYPKYRVYGLFASDWSSPVGIMNFSVNGAWVFGGDASTTAVAYGSINDSYNATGQYWTQIEPDITGNYWVIETTGPILTIKGVNKTGNERGSLSAVIIEEIPSFLPYHLVPAFGVETPVDQILSWQQLAEFSGQGITYQVYLGTEPNELSPNYYGKAPVKTTTTESDDFFYDPATDLANSETYYWRVDTLEPNLPGDPLVHTGAEWWFTTQPASPRIEVDPISQTVPAGTTQVEFSVSGINIATYQWYKDSQPLSANAARYTGENTATLTVYDIQVDDEGFYHCVADNSLNEPDSSAAAQLLIERLVGWWKLDGDLTDSVPVGVTHDGASVDPNFVAIGKDGGALEFFGDADGLVVISNSADFFNFYPRGYTIAAWVKTTQTGWGAYMGKEERPGDPWKGFILTQTSGNAIHTLRQAYDGDLGSGTKVADDAWHYVTGTYDASLKQIKVYVDGVLRNQASTTAIPSPNPSSLIFGDEALVEVGVDPFARYVGLLDDIRIWSYAVDPVTIATQYVDFNPGSEVCVENPEYDVAGPDGVGDEFRDCRVNLYDFVPFAEVWLNCNIVPTCIP